MNSEMQSYFKDHLYTEAKHKRFLHELQTSCGSPIDFRIAEMPIFVDYAMRTKLVEYAIEILKLSIQAHRNLDNTNPIPNKYNVPNESDNPLFSVIDFAITENPNGEFEPKVIELQGFPSLFGYQLRFAQSMKHVYDLGSFTPFPEDLEEQTYVDILRANLVGQYDPDETCLLEYKPEQQKTKPDFSVIEQITGMKTTDIQSVKQVGNQLFHQRNGKWVRIRRVFNRAIADELDENNVELPFQWNQDIDIEWAGHPNWYFTISKHILPFLSHPAIPTSTILSEIEQIPASLEPFVVKPLFAFAGKGVIINPTRSDIKAIPSQDRASYMLQEKVEYADCIDTPHGKNKVEIRIMLIWPESQSNPIPVMTLARTGRGLMMGTRYNNLPWTGSSGCLFG